MKRFLLSFNWPLFLAMTVLAAVGIVFIRSAGSARAAETLREAWRVHAFTAVLGLGVYFAFAVPDWRKWFDAAAVPYYALALLFLVTVLLFGAKIYGGRRWLWFFQPSEFAKPAVVMLVASFFGKAGTDRTGFRHLLLGLAFLAVPAALILAEPDLGTALVLVPTVIAMLLAARVCLRVLVPALLAALLAGAVLVGAVWEAEHAASPETREKIYRMIPLKPHQIKRLKVFVAPESDPYGGGWNLRQAKISIGSGSFSGKGIGRGEQKFLGYLPPSVSMNDFIFAVLAEETGFAGSAGTLALFAVLVFAGLWTALRCPDERGRLFAVGVTTLVFTHVYVNIAMSVGLVPITGLPLPFISAGKTFLVSLTAALGIVQSISIHKGESNAQ